MPRRSKPAPGIAASSDTPEKTGMAGGSAGASFPSKLPASLPKAPLAEQDISRDKVDPDLLPDEPDNLLEAAMTADSDADAPGAEGPDHCRFVLRKNSLKRLDVYLHQRLKGISRTRIQKLIDLGGVTVNDKQPKASTTVHLGDVIDVILPPPAIRTIIPEPIPLKIVYEDQAMIVINKQADLIVHPARSHTSGTLVNALAHHFQQQTQQAGQTAAPWRTSGFREVDREKMKSSSLGPSSSNTTPGQVTGLSSVGSADLRPGIVHRLDKNTTGVMVVAKTDEAHWQIARQFENRTTIKAYLALVHGQLPDASGLIEEPIGKHPTIREAYAVRHDSSSRHAVTLYRVRQRYRGYCLVELELKTGRTHQIRVHLSYLGHPIVGDIIYGGEPIGERELLEPPVPAGGRQFLNFARLREEGLKIETLARARKDIILATPALHAGFLRFIHPYTGQPVTFTAPLHQPMLGLVRRLQAASMSQGSPPNPKGSTRRGVARTGKKAVEGNLDEGLNAGRNESLGSVAREGWWIDLAQAIPQTD